jgi:formylglycine-generating enzyme required for sulfatase activity
MLDGFQFFLPLGWHLSKSALSSIESARSRETMRSLNLIRRDLMGSAADEMLGAKVGEEDLLREQYHWRVLMGAAVLTPEQEKAAKPGSNFKECATACPTMVIVPSGEFTMGSPDDEPERDSGEAQVRVTISRPFAVGKFAVTFDEWDACAAAGGCKGYWPSDEGWGRGNWPVINVSWDDAKAYVAWLSRVSGKPYRLLSEAEREYVARAGTTTPFWFGSSITPKRANYRAPAEPYESSGSHATAGTMPVDNFEPNPWGLYNVHGNVAEWTEDCWNENNSGHPGNGGARTDGDCDGRVLRGGSWSTYPRVLRSAHRGFSWSQRLDSIGFRVARTLDR